MGEPAHLGSTIDTEHTDFCPMVSGMVRQVFVLLTAPRGFLGRFNRTQANSIACTANRTGTSGTVA
jgi:hypothetical protein